jgi:hypothetical protein
MEANMATPDIKSLDVDGLLALRAQIDTRLSEKRHEQKVIARLNGDKIGNGKAVKRRGKSLKAVKSRRNFAARKTRS